MLGWLSALQARAYGDRVEVQVLLQEANELTAIFTASHKTASRHRAERKQRDKDERERKKRKRRIDNP